VNRWTNISRARTWRLLTILVVAVGFWTLVAWFAARHLVVSAPLQRADAIIVLSGSACLLERTKVAGDLYSSKVASRVVLTNDNLQGTGAITLALWFFGLALAMGWVMAPATSAVVGAVPAAKSGIASATNTVARMVSGALGVAVIGSLVSSLYSNDVDGSLVGLPARAQVGAEDSIGAASTIAAQLPGDAGSSLLATAGDAFTQAMGNGLLVAAALAAVTAVVVLRFLRAREPAEGVASLVAGQDGESLNPQPQS